jgi:lauroyl/myristoyl acyltransferase
VRQGDPLGFDRMTDDRMISAARELVSLGAEAFFSPATNDFVAEVGRRHPARALYIRSTAEAIARYELSEIDPQVAADEIFNNFIWTHYVCKLLMTAAPEITATFVSSHFDVDAVTTSLDAAGPSILSSFHYTAYPLVALRLAMSAAAPLISKARVDVIEQSGAPLTDHVVYMSSRSAAVHLTRALRQGRSVWVLLDVVLPSVRIARPMFLGYGMNVGAGLGKIARLSERPCVPVFWNLQRAGTCVQAASTVLPTCESEERIIQFFVNAQAAFIRQQPTQWLEWYSTLDDAPRLRAAVKSGNEALWERLAPALGQND